MMVDPWGGLVTGLLTQVLGDLVGDLITSIARGSRGAGVTDHVVAVEPRLPGPLRARSLGASELDRLVTGTAALLAGTRRSNDAHLPDHEWAAAVAAVRDSLARCAPVDAGFVVQDARLDPGLLEIAVRAADPDLVATAGLSDRAVAAYDRMLHMCCVQAVEFVTSRPEFPVWVSRELVRQSGLILDDLREVPGKVAQDVVRAEAAAQRSAALDADQAFTQRYARFVVGRLDEVEVVGVTLRQTPPRYALDIAYTALSAARATTGDGALLDGDDLTGSGVAVTGVLVATRRAVLRGAAGSGKTTTLQRLAVDAGRTVIATQGRASLDAPVPFLIPLRRFVSRGLPDPEHFLDEVARPLASAAPSGWADRLLASGRALVLVDGVDEVPSHAVGASQQEAVTLRSDIEAWITDLVTAYPMARFVVTSRLSAVPDGWLGRAGFETFDLLPMGPNSIRDLVERWHDAVSRDVPAAQTEVLQHYRSWLPNVIARRAELHRLAATPLLCALICALNWDRRMELPTDRAGIYEAALDMLLDRRDVQRGVTAPEGIELAAREQWVLLQRLAYYLVRNELSELTVDVAREQVNRVMPRIRAREAAADDVLRHLLTRTGLLRQDAASGSLHFAHRTFQDYLAAREALEEGDLGLLVHRGHDDRWLDVIVMAAAQARPRECGSLLTGLLDRGAREPNERERLHLVAAAAVAQSVVVEPAEIRSRVERATADLIPPLTGERAQALARAGDFVVDLLPGPEGLDDQAAAYVVRTAALIGTEAARDLILRFVPAEPTPLIVDELLRAWRAAPQPEEYARTVLAAIRFGDATVAVHRHRLPYLRLLPHLHAAKYLGDLVDLEAFARMPALRTLELFQNDALRDRHLSTLAGCPQLRSLVIVRCSGLRDLSGLGEIGLTQLDLAFNEQLDVTSLASLTTLRSLRVRLRRLSDLQQLPELPGLRHLAYGGRLPEATLEGIERLTGLEHVEIIGTPSSDDVLHLAQLPHLTRLTWTAAAADDAQDWIGALQEARPNTEVIVVPATAATSRVA